MKSFEKSWNISLIVEVCNTPKNEACKKDDVCGEDVKVSEGEPPLENSPAVSSLAKSVKTVNCSEVFQEIRDYPGHGKKIPDVYVFLFHKSHEDDQIE